MKKIFAHIAVLLEAVQTFYCSETNANSFPDDVAHLESFSITTALSTVPVTINFCAGTSAMNDVIPSVLLSIRETAFLHPSHYKNSAFRLSNAQPL
jgi:hypothetical protein